MMPGNRLRQAGIRLDNAREVINCFASSAFAAPSLLDLGACHPDGRRLLGGRSYDAAAHGAIPGAAQHFASAQRTISSEAVTVGFPSALQSTMMFEVLPRFSRAAVGSFLARIVCPANGNLDACSRIG